MEAIKKIKIRRARKGKRKKIKNGIGVYDQIKIMEK